jgi:hypothetical protein
VNLYFRGHGDDAPLIEIELEFLRCEPRKIAAAFIGQLGQPKETLGNALYWPGERANLFARLPADDGVCLVHFVIPDDTKRLAVLRAGAESESGGATN